VALLKYAVGPDVAFSAISLMPVAYTTWFASRRAGLAAAFLSALSLLLLNLHLKHAGLLVLYWNGIMDFAVFTTIAWSLATIKTLYEQTRQLSREDPLTGLLNRRAFFEMLEDEVNRARRYDYPLTLTYVDLDDFKMVNDRLGHAAGDDLLRHVGRTLRQVVRTVDVVGRLGGDEFSLLLTHVDPDAAPAMLEKIHGTLQETDGRPGAVSLSVGAVTFVQPTDPYEMIQTADQVMYNAKRAGKNRLIHEVR